MVYQPRVKKIPYVNKNGKPDEHVMLGSSFSKLGGSYCPRNENPNYNCLKCRNNSCD